MLEVKESQIYKGRKTIYAENNVSDELINKVKELMETEELIKVSFDVMGETLHNILSYQLKEKLPEFKFGISRYNCTIVK